VITILLTFEKQYVVRGMTFSVWRQALQTDLEVTALSELVCKKWTQVTAR